MPEKKTILKSILLTSASFAGYNIGSGFATGIEGMQFFSAWGAKYAFLGVLISMIVASAVLMPVYIAGFERDFGGSSEVYRYFCGPRLGAIFDGYVYISITLVILTMMSGAGATIHQRLGIPEFMGTGLIGILCVAAALLGLEKLMRALSCVGTFIILFVVGCCIYVFFVSETGPFSGSVNVESYAAAGKILRAHVFGVQNPYLSAVASAGLLIGSGLPWAFATGTLCQSREEAALSGVFSGVFYYLAKVLVIYLTLTSMDSIAGVEVPILAVIQHYLPALSFVYSCIIILAIFSTVSGRLFLLASRFDHGNRKIHLAIIVSVVVFAAVAGSVIPFSKISNISFSLSGAVGIILSLLILIKFFSSRFN